MITYASKMFSTSREAEEQLSAYRFLIEEAGGTPASKHGNAKRKTVRSTPWKRQKMEKPRQTSKKRGDYSPAGASTPGDPARGEDAFHTAPKQ